MKARGLVGSAGPPITAAVVRLLGATLRVRFAGLADLTRRWAQGEPLIYAVWHGRLLLVPWLAERLSAAYGARPATVLVSRSEDGEFLARYIRRFGLDVVRGSSSRGGAAAARALVGRLRSGHDVAVVPDGPRGPRCQLQPGVIALAALTGAPIVPLAVGVRPRHRFASWDEFMAPWPFARCATVFGPPIHIERDADRTRAAKEVEWRLDEVTAAADRLVGW